jgi:glycosyltransferase involved in cell wall biosynthesis
MNEIKILVIGPLLPYYDRSAWGVRLFNMLKILSRNYKIIYFSWSEYKGQEDEKYTSDLKGMNIDVYTEENDFMKIIKQNDFYATLIEYFNVAEYFLPRIRMLKPRCPIIVDSIDVHYHRLWMQYGITKNLIDYKEYLDVKRREISIYKKADLVLAVTEEDVLILRDEDPNLRIEVVPNIYDIPNDPKDRNVDKNSLIFIGGFKHKPNVDAVFYFCNIILPKLIEKNPQIHLTIIGESPSAQIMKLDSKHVKVLGYVPSVTPYLMKNYVSIAPLRFGAGMKGKINEAMAHGIPVVSTSVGVQGMKLRHKQEIMIADEPEDFIKCIQELINDNKLYSVISTNSVNFIKENYTSDKVANKLEEIIADVQKLSLKNNSLSESVKLITTSIINRFCFLRRNKVLSKKSNIKVLFVQGNSDNISGQELSLFSRMEGLRQEGIDCLVLLPRKGIFSDFLEERGFPVRFIELNRLSKKNLFSYMKTVLEITRLIGKERISLIHTSGVYPVQYSLPAARLSRIPCIAHINQTIYSEYDFKSSFIKYADFIVTVAEKVKEKLTASIRINPYKIKVVYDAIISDKKICESDDVESIKKRLNIERNVKLIGQVGQIIPRKGLEYFIEMAKIVKEKFPNTKFLIIGTAPEEYREHEQYLLKLVNDLGLKNDVIFTGFQRNIYDFIRLLDISVLASLDEGLARTIVESLELGKPVVSTSVSGMPEIVINNKTGILVNPKDLKGLAEAVLYLLNNPEKAKELGENGRMLVLERFTMANHTKSMIDIYAEIFHKIIKKKILFYEPSSGCGGSASALSYIIDHLDRQKFHPFAVIKNHGTKIDKIKDVELIKLRDYHEPMESSNIKFFFFFLSNILPESIKLFFILKSKKIDILHINTNIITGIPAIIASKLTGVPCVCHIRETRKMIKRERVFSKWVNKFIVINNDALDIHKKYMRQDKIEMIYDGIDFEEFADVEKGNFKKEFNFDSQPIVGSIGRIIAGKGQKEFILSAKETLKIKPRAKFIIVGEAKGGDVTYYQEVKELTEKEHLKSEITFTGWRSDVKNIISDLDVLVLPSTTFPEGLPNVIIEAMALGKPVVSTKIPGPTDIVIDGKTGFLVPAGDIKAMSDKIIFLLDNQGIAKQMGEEGRKRAEELFDIKKQVKEIEGIYEEVLFRK